MAFPFLPVDIKRLLPVLDEIAPVDHGAEVLSRLLIDALIVNVDRRVKINLGFDHMKERIRVALRFLSRLFGAQYIIRLGSHLFNQFLLRSYCLKSFYSCQFYHPSSIVSLSTDFW